VDRPARYNGNWDSGTKFLSELFFRLRNGGYKSFRSSAVLLHLFCMLIVFACFCVIWAYITMAILVVYNDSSYLNVVQIWPIFHHFFYHNISWQNFFILEFCLSNLFLEITREVSYVRLLHLFYFPRHLLFTSGTQTWLMCFLYRISLRVLFLKLLVINIFNWLNSVCRMFLLGI
jgi:hypothetical protein